MWSQVPALNVGVQCEPCRGVSKELVMQELQSICRENPNLRAISFYEANLGKEG